MPSRSICLCAIADAAAESSVKFFPLVAKVGNELEISFPAE